MYQVLGFGFSSLETYSVSVLRVLNRTRFRFCESWNVPGVHQYGPDKYARTLTPTSRFVCFVADVRIASAMMYTYTTLGKTSMGLINTHVR